MEDFSAKVSEILNSPEGMQQLQTIASMLGLGQGQSSQEPETQHTAAPSAPSGLGGSGIDLQMLLTLQKAFSGMNQQDNNTNLLYALKPHLSGERQKRVDDAVRIMQLIKILPLLKESGLFESLGLGTGEANRG